MDPFVHYCFSTYVIVLIMIPTYLYCLTGLSLFLMILESVLKYNNLQTTEAFNLTPEQKEQKIMNVKKVIAALNWFPLVCTIGILLFFAIR
jgi:hypothetical protein